MSDEELIQRVNSEFFLSDLPKDFLRLKGNTIETSSRRYRRQIPISGIGDVTLQLVSALPIGDNQYNPQLKELLAPYQFILFEGPVVQEKKGAGRASSGKIRQIDLVPPTFYEELTKGLDKVDLRNPYLCEGWENAIRSSKVPKKNGISLVQVGYDPDDELSFMAKYFSWQNLKAYLENLSLRLTAENYVRGAINRDYFVTAIVEANVPIPKGIVPDNLVVKTMVLINQAKYRHLRHVMVDSIYHHRERKNITIIASPWFMPPLEDILTSKLISTSRYELEKGTERWVPAFTFG
ncbi:hypothetical protein HYU14_02135 [Candidatus Woesearchaeota archaeon]|nr:hypothetical protein [Candidatus Woesearchaeota archaeon]